LVKGIFGIVNGKYNENVNPISSEKINKRWKGDVGPWGFEYRQKNDAKCKGTYHPSEIDALHLTSTPINGRRVLFNNASLILSG
jgi:hypothetical protein